MFYEKWHSPEVQEWVYRLMHDSDAFEKFRYKDNIENYTSLIDDCQKQLQSIPIGDFESRDKLFYIINEAKKRLS